MNITTWLQHFHLGKYTFFLRAPIKQNPLLHGGHKYLLAVCEHNHTTIIQIHTLILTRPAVLILMQCDVTFYMARTRGMIVSPALLSTLSGCTQSSIFSALEQL